jgi:hypothetical protein
LVLCNHVFDRLVAGFRHLFSFPCFDFWFVAVLGFLLRWCAASVHGLGVI